LTFSCISIRFCSAFIFLSSFFISFISFDLLCYSRSSIIRRLSSFFFLRICFPNKFYCCLCTRWINSLALRQRSD
jgi:hypothetical protein